jgi:hypothetical protein
MSLSGLSGAAGAAGSGANPLFTAGQALGSGIGTVAKTALSPISGLANGAMSGLGLMHQTGGALNLLQSMSPQDRMAYVGSQMAQQGAAPGGASAVQRPGTPGVGVPGMPQAPSLTSEIMSGAPAANTAVPGSPAGGQGLAGLNLNDPATMMRIRQMIQAGLLG